MLDELPEGLGPALDEPGFDGVGFDGVGPEELNASGPLLVESVILFTYLERCLAVTMTMRFLRNTLHGLYIFFPELPQNATEIFNKWSIASSIPELG